MKALASLSYKLMFLLFAFVPACSLIAVGMGYEFTLKNPMGFSIAAAAISTVCSLILLCSRSTKSKLDAFLSVFIAPLSAVTGIVMLRGNYVNAALVIFAVCFICTFIVLFKYARPIFLRIIAIIFSCFAMAVYVIGVAITVFLGGLAVNTVAKTVESPDGSYIAEVIDSDQGALGGDTLVEVSNVKDRIDLYIAEFTRPSVRVYMGEWGEAESMEISWKDNSTVVINGREYLINAK